MSTNKNTHTKYTCELCSFTSEKYNDYQRHIHTNKHKIRVNANNDPSNYAIYTCDCGKIYKHQSSLCKHLKKCSQLCKYDISNNERIDPPPENELVSVLLKQNTIFQELIMKNEEEKKELLMKNEVQQRKTEERENQMMDLQHQFLEAIKNGSLGNTTNSNNNNTQNNQFNLQFYLNETCKDAINLDEFLQSIQLTSQDYVNTGEVGFITGLTDIFRKELHKLEPHNRPLQCTDVKREVIYVKENDKWAKDIENKKTKNIVRRIDLSYQRMMYQWMKENPEHVEEEGPLVEEGIKYSTVCLGNNRLNGNEPIFRNKIFTNILDDIAIKKGNKVITVE